MLCYLSMRTLLIETSTEMSCIALFDGENKMVVPLPPGKELSKVIAQKTHNLLKNKELSLDQILVGAGPGSLTGVRVGKALAKALAFGYEVPLKEFCSMELFAPKDVESFAVLFDARMGGIYVLKKGESPKLIQPEKVPDLIARIPYLVSPHPELVEKRINTSIGKACWNFSEIILELKPNSQIE